MNEKINQHLKTQNHILLYQQKLQDLYKNHRKDVKSVYIITPKKGKVAIESIIRTVDSTIQTKGMTIGQMLDMINKKTTSDELHIFIDHFEQLTKRELEYYRELSDMKNVYLIVNICEDQQLIDNEFIKKFIIIGDEFYTNRSASINIKFTLLILLSSLIFLIFLKLQLSLLNILVSTLWFTFLMYRSFYYVMH